MMGNLLEVTGMTMVANEGFSARIICSQCKSKLYLVLKQGELEIETVKVAKKEKQDGKKNKIKNKESKGGDSGGEKPKKSDSGEGIGKGGKTGDEQDGDGNGENSKPAKADERKYTNVR